MEDDGIGKYDRFKKMEKEGYKDVNQFLREKTYITAREWAIARLCSDFKTETGIEMKKIGENLPDLVPFMEDKYTPQAVNQARTSFIDKVKKSGATFFYGSMSGFFSSEQLNKTIQHSVETAKFLIEVEGDNIEEKQKNKTENKIGNAMKNVLEASEKIRNQETEENNICPNCGNEL